jgi:hypothetical protein
MNVLGKCIDKCKNAPICMPLEQFKKIHAKYEIDFDVDISSCPFHERDMKNVIEKRFDGDQC